MGKGVFSVNLLNDDGSEVEYIPYRATARAPRKIKGNDVLDFIWLYRMPLVLCSNPLQY